MRFIKPVLLSGLLFLTSSTLANAQPNVTEIWYVSVESWVFEWIKTSGEPPGPELFQEIAIPPSPGTFSALETMYRASKNSGSIVSYRSNCNPSSSGCSCIYNGFIDGAKASGTVMCDTFSAPKSWRATIENNDKYSKKSL